LQRPLDLLRERLGVGALAVEGRSFLSQVEEQRVVVVSRGGTHAQRHTGVLIALQGVVVDARVGEQWPEYVAPSAREGSDGDGRQVVTELGQLALFGRHTHLGVGDLSNQGSVVVDGHGVVLGEDVRALLEPLEFVDDPLHLSLGLVDTRGDRHLRLEGGHGDQECCGHHHDARRMAAL
jgi:hypothetical protein